MVKKNHLHSILPTIYPDRFLLQNRDKVRDLRNKVSVLRRKIAYLKRCLDRYMNFNNSGNPLEQALSMVLHFYSKQGQEKPVENEGLSAGDL